MVQFRQSHPFLIPSHSFFMTLPTYRDDCYEHQQGSVTSHIEDLNPEPAYTGEEPAHVEAHIRGVQADLLHQYNHHHSYIYTLPPEVLGDIFLWTCTVRRDSWEKFGEPTRGQATVLSSVSSYWRWVALQTPKLWSTVTFDPRGPTSKIKGGLLRQHLKHGVDLDISLDLWDRDLMPGSTTTLEVPSGSLPAVTTYALHCQSIANILFAPENIQKITSLRIEYPPPEWLAKISWLPHLHTLVLDGIRSQQDMPLVLNLRDLPLCRVQLSLYNFNRMYGPLNLPSTVQELFTSGLEHDIVSGFLYRCPNLTKVCVSDPPELSSRSISTTRFTPLTLSHLEDLTWPVGDFLHPIPRLSLPALKYLHLVDPDGDYGYRNELNSPVEPILTLCRQLSDTLESLELTGSPPWTVETLKHLLHNNIPHLEVLELANWPPHSLITVIQVLTPSKREFNQEVIKALPRLRSLVIVRADLTPYYDSTPVTDASGPDLSRVRHAVGIAKVSLKMLERRRAGQLDPFFLDLPPLYTEKDNKHVWSAKLQDGFRRVVRGRSLDIRQQSEILEWLYT